MRDWYDAIRMDEACLDRKGTRVRRPEGDFTVFKTTHRYFDPTYHVDDDGLDITLSVAEGEYLDEDVLDCLADMLASLKCKRAKAKRGPV